MRISDWSSDVCSSDLRIHHAAQDRVRRVVMDIYQPQCFPSENGNRAVAHRAPPLYMERGPGRVFFILTDAVGKAAWVTERALVQLIGPSATEVEDHQPNRPAERRIGTESWTKHEIGRAHV